MNDEESVKWDWTQNLLSVDTCFESLNQSEINKSSPIDEFASIIHKVCKNNPLVINSQASKI